MGIWKVIYASVEKKKTIEEIVDESQKLVDEVKKVDEKAEKAVAEKKLVLEENHNQKVEEAMVPKAEVIIQMDSSDSIIKIDNKIEQQCKKWMETCSACIEKDENFKNRDIEFTKTEKIFKRKLLRNA
ncbi:hypothetical protein Hanom_Chr17g01584711 [Helianthus anomalus]